MEKVKKILIDFAKTIVVSLLLVVFVTNFVFFPIKIVGHSMDHTLNDGDYGFTFIFNKWINNFKRFDIVTVKLDNADSYYVKRLVGLPGDEIKFSDNVLYINGVKQEEKYLDKEQITNDFEIKLKDDEYFVLGDNRLNSLDGRYFGPIKKHNIKSSGIIIFFPFNHLGIKK